MGHPNNVQNALGRATFDAKCHQHIGFDLQGHLNLHEDKIKQKLLSRILLAQELFILAPAVKTVSALN